MKHSRSRTMFVMLALVGMFVIAGLQTPTAFAQGTENCPLEATVASLQACVQHAAEMGFIDNAGVTQSLLAKLGAAQAAVERGQPGVAVQVIGAFEGEVTAQAGKHIDAGHAQHMLSHAQLVMQALAGEALGSTRGVAVM